jgi:hypothetical protein
MFENMICFTKEARLPTFKHCAKIRLVNHPTASKNKVCVTKNYRDFIRDIYELRTRLRKEKKVHLVVYDDDHNYVALDKMMFIYNTMKKVCTVIYQIQ